MMDTKDITSLLESDTKAAKVFRGVFREKDLYKLLDASQKVILYSTLTPATNPENTGSACARTNVPFNTLTLTVYTRQCIEMSTRLFYKSADEVADC